VVMERISEGKAIELQIAAPYPAFNSMEIR
jgi:hypothetical protein